MRSSTIVGFVITALLIPVARAGEYNLKLSVGDPAPAWENLSGTDGKQHSLSDFKDKEAVVLAFTCLSCPYAIEYEERFNNLAKQLGGPDGKVGFVAVCVNRIPADRLDKLTERVNSQKLAFPIMYDESQKIANDYGAICTPEFYVLNKERKITYIGALDDSTDATKVQKRFVEEGLVAALKGELPLVKETLARGCKIRYVRERK